MLNSLSRRQVAVGLCSCGAAGLLGGHAHAAPGGGGCSLTVAEYETIVAPTASDFAFAARDIGLSGESGTSGDRNFDQALAITLMKLSKTFGVLPSFSFFEEDRGINAFFIPVKRTPGRPDGAVAYGRKLLKWQTSDGVPNVGRVVGVCAHEFGHALQHKRGTIDKLKSMSNGSAFRNELHADFLAGYFAGIRKLEKPDFPAAEIAYGQFTVGDDQFDSKGHHGTPEQRGEAARQGFKQAYESKVSLDEAFETGFRYAKAQKLQKP